MIRFFIDFGRKYFFLLSTKDYDQCDERSYFCLCFNNTPPDDKVNLLIKFIVERKEENRLSSALQEIRLNECSTSDGTYEQINGLVNHYLKDHSSKLCEFLKYVAFNSNDKPMRKSASDILAFLFKEIMEKTECQENVLSLDLIEMQQFKQQTGISPSNSPETFGLNLAIQLHKQITEERRRREIYKKERRRENFRLPRLYKHIMEEREIRRELHEEQGGEGRKENSPLIRIVENCILCHSPIDDVQRLGPKYQFDELVVHYFCLLFADNLSRKGHREDGILGFLKGDIMRVMNRSKMIECVFCHEMGATSRCREAACRAEFHYLCGLDNDIFSQFEMDQFRYCGYCFSPRFTILTSFFSRTRCSQHRVQHYSQSPLKCILSFTHMGCEKDLQGLPSIETPCCNSPVHRNCLQKVILSRTNQSFDCPVTECKDQEIFVPGIQLLGIHITGRSVSDNQRN